VDGGTGTTQVLKAVDTGVGQINGQAGQAGPMVTKLALTPGAHSISCTYIVLSGNARFDGYSIVPTGTTPPTIVFPSLHKLTSGGYSLYYDASPTTANPYAPMTDTMIDSYNTAIASLCGEVSDGRVVYVDIDSVLNKQNLSDFLHPSDYGAQLVAAAVYDAFPTLLTFESASFATSTNSNDWTPIPLSSNWANRSSQGFNSVQDVASWRHDATGKVMLRGLVQPTLNPTTGGGTSAQIGILPVNCVPRAFKQLSAVCDTGIARIDIQPTAGTTPGSISVISGSSAGGWVDLESIQQWWPST
jgi:hypothetical protein